MDSGRGDIYIYGGEEKDGKLNNHLIKFLPGPNILEILNYKDAHKTATNNDSPSYLDQMMVKLVIPNCRKFATLVPWQDASTNRHYLVLYGGCSAQGQHLTTPYKFDVLQKIWEPIQFSSKSADYGTVSIPITNSSRRRSTTHGKYRKRKGSSIVSGVQEPLGRFMHSCVVHDHLVYIYGGYNTLAGSPLDDMWTLDPNRGWTRIIYTEYILTAATTTPTSTPATSTTVEATTIGSMNSIITPTIHITTPTSTSAIITTAATIEDVEIEPKAKPRRSSILRSHLPETAIQPNPERRCGSSTIVWKEPVKNVDLMFIFGGDLSGSGSCCDELWVFNLSNKKWKRIDDTKGITPASRWGHSATLFDHRWMFVSGGRKTGWFSTVYNLNDVFAYDLTANSWFEIEIGTTLNRKSIDFGSLTFSSANGSFYVFGGDTDEGLTGSLFRMSPLIDSLYLNEIVKNMESIQGRLDMLEHSMYCNSSNTNLVDESSDNLNELGESSFFLNISEEDQEPVSVST